MTMNRSAWPVVNKLASWEPVESASAAGSLLTQQPVIRVLTGDPVKTLQNCGLSGERPTPRDTLSAFYVSLRRTKACGEMFPIAPDSRPSRRERSRRSTKPSRAASLRLDPQTLRESSSYALLVNGSCLRTTSLVGISACRGRRFHFLHGSARANGWGRIFPKWSQNSQVRIFPRLGNRLC